MRNLVREAIHGPVVDELRLVHRFMRTPSDMSLAERIVIDVGAQVPDAHNRFARDGWRVFGFDPERDPQNDFETFCGSYATPECKTAGVACDRAPIEQVNLLNVDAEGKELVVLQRFPWDGVKPDVVVCNFEDGKTGNRFQHLADFLVMQGYQLLVSEWHPITCYETAYRWRRYVPYPCQLVSPHAWGKLIAVQGCDELARLRGMAQA
jgi:hypothetical protein